MLGKDILNSSECKIHIICCHIQDLIKIRLHSFFNNVDDLLNYDILAEFSMIFIINWPVIIEPHLNLRFIVDANGEGWRIIHEKLLRKQLVRVQSIN